MFIFITHPPMRTGNNAEKAADVRIGSIVSAAIRAGQQRMPALPPKANIVSLPRYVSFVPIEPRRVRDRRDRGDKRDHSEAHRSSPLVGDPLQSALGGAWAGNDQVVRSKTTSARWLYFGREVAGRPGKILAFSKSRTYSIYAVWQSRRRDQ